MFQSSTVEKRRSKLGELVESEGYDNLEHFLKDNAHDSVVLSICLKDGCSYTAYVEGDQREGWYEACCDNTVVSGLVLAEMI